MRRSLIRQNTFIYHRRDLHSHNTKNLAALVLWLKFTDQLEVKQLMMMSDAIQLQVLHLYRFFNP